MKPRLFVFLFVAAVLVVLVTIAAACGDDDESDEDAIRDTIEEMFAACNEGDSERVAEVASLGCPPGAPNDQEVLSVTVDGDEATAEVILTDNDGDAFEFIVVLRKEDGRWLVHRATPTPQ